MIFYLIVEQVLRELTASGANTGSASSVQFVKFHIGRCHGGDLVAIGGGARSAAVDVILENDSI